MAHDMSLLLSSATTESSVECGSFMPIVSAGLCVCVFVWIMDADCEQRHQKIPGEF